VQISTRGRYGLRAMLDLALNPSQTPIPLRVIAERQGISDAYLEQVINTLRKAGLVTAVRGAHGGYQLARPANTITVGEVLRALEGPIAPVYCVEDNGKTSCERQNFCLTRPLWHELTELINNFLDNKTLQDLAEQANHEEGITYYI